EQIPGVGIPWHLRALAADILLRLGHLLFVVRLGSDVTQEDFDRLHQEEDAGGDDDPPRTDRPPRIHTEDIRDGMAWICLGLAAEFDPHSTLVASDLLKIKYRRQQHPPRSGTAPKIFGELPEDIRPAHEQWPTGGDAFNQISRLLEYLLLRE